MKQIPISLFFILISITSLFSQASEIPTGPTTTIEFSEKEFDWGTITQGEKIRHTFEFTNTGNEPLIIKDAKGSCGCTIPLWPKDPILPGETGQMEVEFNSKGKIGAQNKRVTITANTTPGMTFLNVKGKIVKDETTFISDDPKPVQKKDWKKPSTKDCFAIFPNPTTEVLKLEMKDHLGKNANIMIFDAKGNQLERKQVAEITDEIIEFDVRSYAAGTYYVNIQIGKEAVSTKCFVVAQN